jgi:DNA repair protein RecN (Recombination protein N)
LERVEHNPARLAQLTARLDLLYSLEQKHRVGDLDELLRLAADFREQLDAITHSSDEITALEQRQAALMQTLMEQGTQLTNQRSKGAKQMAGQVVTLLHDLGMPHARFEVELTPLPQPDSTGLDKVRFLFSANKGGVLNPIESVASGGEMARIMLVLKSMLAAVSSMPTLVFDEIDTGVSGEIADRITQMMCQMSTTMQVICITHAPQMAAGGRIHYYVYKTDEGKEANSQIRRLSTEERITEVARMISGASLTDAALAHARELLKSYNNE